MASDTSDEQNDRAAELLDTQFVDYRSDDGLFEAYMACARRLLTPAPCVLVAHDWSGPQPSTQVVAEKLARCGYVGVELDVAFNTTTTPPAVHGPH